MSRKCDVAKFHLVTSRYLCCNSTLVCVCSPENPHHTRNEEGAGFGRWVQNRTQGTWKMGLFFFNLFGYVCRTVVTNRQGWQMPLLPFLFSRLLLPYVCSPVVDVVASPVVGVAPIWNIRTVREAHWEICAKRIVCTQLHLSVCCAHTWLH